MLHALGVEFVQNGYDDSTISESGEKDYRPTGMIFPDQRDLIPFFYPQFFKQNMHPGNFFR
ncbi:hypothetical protein SDC9_162485 [bioreactor metagenome]|uniref:Uncharacterized protein n=1 Tax=bioreactor metagenome TaxID=1076179 RepID=A0A645FN98_9ZZZZ